MNLFKLRALSVIVASVLFVASSGRAATPLAESYAALPGALWELEGRGDFMLLVDERGFCSSSMVLTRSSDDFAAAVSEALRAMRFTPALSNGVPSAMMVRCAVIIDNGLVKISFVEDEEAVLSAMPKLRSSPFQAAPVDAIVSRAVVGLDIDINGRITGARVLSGDEENAQRWLAAARRLWRFEPAKAGRRKTSIDGVLMPLRFDASYEIPSVPQDMDLDLRGGLVGRSGEVLLKLLVDMEGEVLESELASATDAALGEFARREVEDWTLKPARKGGVPYQSSVYLPLRFAGGRLLAAEEIDDAEGERLGSSELRDGPLQAPRIPADARIELPEDLRDRAGEVVLRLAVDAKGAVTSLDVSYSSDDVLAGLAIDAVSQWRFRPAFRGERPVATNVKLPFVFNGGQVASNSKELDQLPVAIASPQPEFGRRSTAGDFALVLVKIDTEGHVVGAYVQESSRRAIEKSCIAAALEWRFTPAMKEGRAVSSSLVIPFFASGAE